MDFGETRNVRKHSSPKGSFEEPMLLHGTFGRKKRSSIHQGLQLMDGQVPSEKDSLPIQVPDDMSFHYHPGVSGPNIN